MHRNKYILGIPMKIGLRYKQKNPITKEYNLGIQKNVISTEKMNKSNAVITPGCLVSKKSGPYHLNYDNISHKVTQIFNRFVRRVEKNKWKIN